MLYKYKRVGLPWRDPDVVDPVLLELGNVLLKTRPVLLICRDIPLEALQHRHVLRCGLLFRHVELSSHASTSEVRMSRSREVRLN